MNITLCRHAARTPFTQPVMITSRMHTVPESLTASAVLCAQKR